MIDAYYVDDLALIVNAPAQANKVLAVKERAIFTFSFKPLKWVHRITYLSSNISSTESDINMRIGKALSAIETSSIIRKSYLSYKIERDFFKAGLYGTNIWMHHLDSKEKFRKSLKGNYARRQHSVFNKS